MIVPVVKVKRDGPKGWHWINASDFDPARHELVDPPAVEPPAEQSEQPQPDAPKRRGRPPKPKES